MLNRYSAKYIDQFGEELTTIENDGKTLCMVVRGVEFTGSQLDDWEPIAGTPEQQLEGFSFNRRELCSFALEFVVPIPVVDGVQTIPSFLQCNLELGEPRSNGGVDREDLGLELFVAGKFYKSSGKSGGWFELELLDIQKMLPIDSYIKCCLSCAYSDYGPAGQGLFGSMACFRNHKQEYLSRKGKAAFFEMENKVTQWVQEIHLCPEFDRRVPGTGYRG